MNILISKKQKQKLNLQITIQIADGFKVRSVDFGRVLFQ